MQAHVLIREARRAAGLTQSALAVRLDTTQSAIARLERDGANPRLDTISRALAACGRTLAIDSAPDPPSIDATLVANRLRLTPGQRLLSFERAYAEARELAIGGRRSRGELA